MAELLSPAGNLRNLRYALAYGADAVYAGQPRYSLRVRNNDFDKLDNLQTGIDMTHRAGKLFFLAVNVLPHNAKLKTFIADLEAIVALHPDALIMADPGLIMLVRERWPDVAIHLSVQANTMNWAAVRFWQSVGIKRIILSRELSLDEIAEIRQQCPDIELEVFVHGALCIAYSGRCLLSGYFNHRDPNQGTCTNACRWDYKTHAAVEDACGDLTAPPLPEGEGRKIGRSDAGKNELFALLEESTRPGELMPVYEDAHGTYIMNSKDLRAVEHVAQLVDMGIDSLKIEGRTKSHYYTARATQVYRHAIDDALAHKPFDPRWLIDLEGLANRGYTEGFYRRHTHDALQNYTQGASRNERQLFVGEALSYGDGWLEIDIKNRLECGDTVEMMTPQGNIEFTLDQMLNKNGDPIDAAPGSGHVVRIAIPQALEPECVLLMKHL
jgi:putative protease